MQSWMFSRTHQECHVVCDLGFGIVLFATSSFLSIRWTAGRPSTLLIWGVQKSRVCSVPHKRRVVVCRGELWGVTWAMSLRSRALLG